MPLGTRMQGGGIGMNIGGAPTRMFLAVMHLVAMDAGEVALSCGAARTAISSGTHRAPVQLAPASHLA